MAQKASLWTRIGSWIRAQPDPSQPLLAAADYDFGLQSTVAREGAGARAPSRFLPKRKRHAASHAVSSRQDQVLDLMASLQDHLNAQNERSDRMVDSLAELAGGMRTLPDAARCQADRLAGLTRELESSNQHIASIVDVVHDWPRATLAQKKALESIAIQLESSAQATDRLAGRLDGLGQMIKMLGQTSSRQVDSLKHMQRLARRHETRMAQLMVHQARRITWLCIGTAGLAIAAVCVGISLIV